MNSLLILKPLPLTIFSISVRRIKRNCFKSYTTQTVIKVKEDKEKANNEIMKEYERLSNISVKVRPKKPQKPPFVKNLFVGVYDTDILTYPQLEKEDVDNLEKEIEPIKSYFNEVSPQRKTPNLASDFMENMRRLKLFGLQGPQLLDARELNVTESCRIYDILGSTTAAATGLIYNDQLGIQALMKKGTEDQKKKYLPQLLKGNVVSAFCVSEANMADFNSLKTKAVRSSDNKTWILNGEKFSVINGAIADLLLVVATTEHLNKMGLKEAKLTAFLVEKGFGGITTNPCETLGIEGTDVSNIKFNNTHVPADNVLGEVNAGDFVIEALLTEFRLSTGTACSAILRKLMDELVNYCTHTNSGGCSIAEADNVRSIIGEITTQLYAIESLTYLTSGLLDQYENQDCQTEAAIVKSFSAEQTCALIMKSMGLIGTAAYMKDHWCNQLYRDALSHLILNESSENLKLNVALLGLQHAGLQMQETVKKVRNPLFYPNDIIKRMWTHRRQNEDNPKLILGLENYLHPSCVISAKWLEYCVLRLQFATETLLARYGPEIINKHVELKRLGECAIDIYTMTACLGRSSRSYCIGLQHADFERLLADAFCFGAMERVKAKIQKVYLGPYSTADENIRTIAKRAFKFGKYFPEHPITRNF